MKKITLIPLATLLIGQFAMADNVIPGAPAWSTPARGAAVETAVSETEVKTLEGSQQRYTQQQIDDKFNAPDWFPERHAPMPDIVKHGKAPKVWACSSCHLASGLGHPESSTLAGLSETYMLEQMKAFASGERLDYSGHMNRMAAAMDDAETVAAVKWFATLKHKPFLTVKETEAVPETYVDETRMRHIKSEGAMEPINGRVIEVPEDKEIIHRRSPDGRFITYVPKGSLARGKTLVETGGGKTLPCMSCHGANLAGNEIGPAIAGNFAIYTVRQLHGFKAGTRKNAKAAMMTPVVAQLSDADIVDIAAYLSSLALDEKSPVKEQ